jgi:hypothetical protein
LAIEKKNAAIVSKLAKVSMLAARSSGDAHLGGQEQDFKRSRIQLECPV